MASAVSACAPVKREHNFGDYTLALPLGPTCNMERTLFPTAAADPGITTGSLAYMYSGREPHEIYVQW